MNQINLLEENNVFVSCGDPERDALIILSQKKNRDAIRELSKILRKNINLDFGWYYSGDNNIIYECGYPNEEKIQLVHPFYGSRYERDLGFFDKSGQLWISKMVIYRDSREETNYNPDVHIDKFKKTTKYMANVFFMNTKRDIERKLQEFYPYAYELYIQMDEDPEERPVEPANFLMAPQLEQLIKANYRFAKTFAYNGWVSDNGALYFNRLCQRGKNLKEIFKTQKVVYESLKDETSVEYWDSIRRMFKNGTLSKDTIEQVIDAHYDKRSLEKIAYILRQNFNGKPVFTFDTLQNYLRRLDMYEAIGYWEAFGLITDYLRMCNILNIEPKIDGDSLKREHDVTARTIRNKRDEIRANTLNASCDYLAKYNFEDDEYLVRGIRGYDDLIDEAKQQHNCVACYADAISSHRSLIYVMRKKEKPDISFVTIELSPNLKEIRQKFLAYNKPVRDKSVTDFLDKWLDSIKTKEGLE